MQSSEQMNEQRTVLALFVVASLILSSIGIIFPLVNAQAQQAQAKNWERGHYDAWGSSFNPQNQITKDTVSLLELKWVFIPDLTSGGFQGTPLVYEGLLIVTSNNDRRVYALNAETGKVVWSFRPPPTSIGHTHYWTLQKGIVYLPLQDTRPSINCALYGLDALTATVRVNMTNLCPPSLSIFRGTYSNGAGPDIDEKRNIMIWGPTGSESGARCFIAGYDMNTKNLLWRWYMAPPIANGTKISDNPGADKGKPWGVADASKGNISPWPGDWGQGDTIGGGCSWTNKAIDEETGLVYFGTGNPAPDYNATVRPGPNLFTNAIAALNINTGELVWYYQTTPHDLYDVDCSWGVILTTVNIGGAPKKVVTSGCKSGYQYALEAATGKVVWKFNPPNVRRVNTPNIDAGDKADMVGDLFPLHGPLQCPHWAIESYQATDGKTLFVGAANVCQTVRKNNVGRWPIPFSGVATLAPPGTDVNSTFYAVDMATGQAKWSYYHPEAYHSGVMLSGGVVYFAPYGGGLQAHDADTGKVLWTKDLGGQLGMAPVMGATSKGNMRIFVGTGGGIGSPRPTGGAIFSFGLPDKLPEPQVITKEVVKEVIKEVPKEVVKEVPKEVVKTVTVETTSPTTYVLLGLGLVVAVVGVVAGRRSRKQT